MPRYRLAALAISCVLLTCSYADEGMWTFDNPPLKQLKDKYNFVPTQQWLDHVRLSSARLNDGGSGSFISSHGLLLTNHHVARGQLQKNSTAGHDYIKNGFYAATQDQELKAPDLEVNVLVSMENVTQRVSAALKTSQTAGGEFAARRAVIAQIERESQQKTGLRSDVVTLYQGGEYWLYRYKKYTDLRIVFAPEHQIAFFGGDLDNFTYPRYDLDMALFRVYENGKPIDTPNYLHWNPKGAANGELVFESGNPGRTGRLDTMAQLEFARDYVEPDMIKISQTAHGCSAEVCGGGSGAGAPGCGPLLRLANGIKSREGSYKGLLDSASMAQKRKQEDEFKSGVMANPRWKAAYGSAWDEIARAEAKAASRFKEGDLSRS